MMKPPFVLVQTRETKSKFKAVLGDHIPRDELRRLKASLEAMDLNPDYQDDYYADATDGLDGDFNGQELIQRPQQDS